jgi:hypothetical protein
LKLYRENEPSGPTKLNYYAFTLVLYLHPLHDPFHDPFHPLHNPFHDPFHDHDPHHDHDPFHPSYTHRNGAKADFEKLDNAPPKVKPNASAPSSLAPTKFAENANNAFTINTQKKGLNPPFFLKTKNL